MIVKYTTKIVHSYYFFNNFYYNFGLFQFSHPKMLLKFLSAQEIHIDTGNDEYTFNQSEWPLAILSITRDKRIFYSLYIGF